MHEETSYDSNFAPLNVFSNRENPVRAVVSECVLSTFVRVCVYPSRIIICVNGCFKKYATCKSIRKNICCITTMRSRNPNAILIPCVKCICNVSILFIYVYCHIYYNSFPFCVCIRVRTCVYSRAHASAY